MVQPPPFQAFDRARQHREPLADLERRLNDVRDDIVPVGHPEAWKGTNGHNQSIGAYRPV
jgi:hypothetical protein